MGHPVDTLSMFDELKKSFSEEQAHTLSELLKRIEEESLEVVASKKDLKETEMRLTIRFGAMLTAAVTAIVLLNKIL